MMLAVAEQRSFSFAHAPWWRVSRNDPRARALADRHYSRQSVGAAGFMPPGRLLVLLTPCARAVWGVVENLDPAGGLHWRCSIFRNEGAGLSSDLIRDATTRTYAWWTMHYGALPAVPLRTEIDVDRTARGRSRRSRPGECFLRAGWSVVGCTSGADKGRTSLLVLQAPENT